MAKYRVMSGSDEDPLIPYIQTTGCFCVFEMLAVHAANRYSFSNYGFIVSYVSAC